MFTNRSQVGNLNEISVFVMYGIQYFKMYEKYDHEEICLSCFSQNMKPLGVLFSLAFSRPYKNSRAGKAVNGNVGILRGLPNWRASSTQATTWFQPLKPTKEYRCNVSDFLIVQINLQVYFYNKPLSFKCWLNTHRYTPLQAYVALGLLAYCRKQLFLQTRIKLYAIL